MAQFIQIADKDCKRWIRSDDVVKAEIAADSNTLILNYRIHLIGYDSIGVARLHDDLMQKAIEALKL